MEALRSAQQACCSASLLPSKPAAQQACRSTTLLLSKPAAQQSCCCCHLLLPPAPADDMEAAAAAGAGQQPAVAMLQQPSYMVDAVEEDPDRELHSFEVDPAKVRQPALLNAKGQAPAWEPTLVLTDSPPLWHAPPSQLLRLSLRPPPSCCSACVQVERVKERCLPDALNYPMLEEYDFKNDTQNPDLGIDLKPNVQV